MSGLRKKIAKQLGEVYAREFYTAPSKWEYEEQIIDTSILPEMKKLSSDEILKGITVYVEPDAIFLNIRMEHIEGYVFHERHNSLEEVINQAQALKDYFAESGYTPKDTEFGFSVILKP